MLIKYVFTELIIIKKGTKERLRDMETHVYMELLLLFSKCWIYVLKLSAGRTYSFQKRARREGAREGKVKDVGNRNSDTWLAGCLHLIITKNL